jgi:hypothetical protein
MKKTVVALAVLGTALALTPMASAQEEATPRFDLGFVTAPGASFKIWIKDGTCPGGPVSITSTGFATVDLPSLSGTFVKQEGSHTATLKCKDTTKVGEIEYTLSEPAPPNTDPFLDKAEYAPGEKIRIHLVHGYKCNGPATSPGFAAPAELTQVRAPDGSPSLVGETTAGSTPGAHQATIKCLTRSITNQFTVKAPPANPPTNTNPPTTTKPGAKPPVVKPKGAPQTGGGGTA